MQVNLAQGKPVFFRDQIFRLVPNPSSALDRFRVTCTNLQSNTTKWVTYVQFRRDFFAGVGQKVILQ
jgi:hypothetical protein